MTRFITVAAAEGRAIPNIPEDGVVPHDDFWSRRLADGDVIEIEPEATPDTETPTTRRKAKEA